jgi:DNA mismatch repair protein MutS
MALVRQHPDVINPFKLVPAVGQDRSFVRDLGLDALLKSVPFYSNGTRELSRKVMVDQGSDLPTVEYRQDILQDLISNGNLLQGILKCITRLNEMGYLLGGFNDEANLANGLRLARAYRDFIMNPPDLTRVMSRGLKEIEAYLTEIRESEEFSGLCQFVETVGDLGGVVFRVSLDSSGLPTTMSAIELVKGDRDDRTGVLAFFRRLLGKKSFETSLKGSGGLNEAGRVLRGFIDAQFVPIIKGYLDQIRQVVCLLEPLGFYAGFAEYFVKLREQKVDVCRPTLFPRERRVMTARQARNPLLLKEECDGRRIVPNDITYTPEQNMFVITGPNNGGKTTYVTTVGLVQLMSQKGLFVPAESAEISLVDGIYTHFVSPDDITKGEGRYRNELMRVKEIFEAATPYSLVILDEPCGGTSYEEGCRQSLVLLDGLHKLGPATYFTTHMHPVAGEVDNARYAAAQNLSVECLYDGKKIKYTYKVKPGAAAKSYGEEIARDIGLMPEGISQMVSKRAQERGYGDIIRQ